ncbi:hypothetical protein T06_280 [Trichinella sp. T6]|nr:hypothetical protein T06_280 [Trichinella sp. T6]
MDISELLPGDKLRKISGVYDDLNNRLRQFGIFHEQLSIDEGMGTLLRCKMLIRGKLTTFGFKIWTVSSVNDKEFLTDSPLMGRAHHHYVANSSKTSEWMDLRNVPVEDFTLAD